ncbi:hypothetical protein [Variovorax sp. KK3]|uniref:hypothetical protein n=1 Tax=Variovorax sp. KK3 TaxID=1855728 RepID=UPI00097C7D06|nr:hypothetical protein [Variovorax sp. KK3]
MRRFISARWVQSHFWAIALICAVALPTVLIVLLNPHEEASRTEFVAALIVYVLPTSWALLIARRARLDLAAEEQTLMQIDENGQRLQTRLASGETVLTVDGDTWEQFVVGAKAHHGVMRTSVRMVQSLCHEAASGRFPPISTLAQIYANELRDGTRRLRGPQTLALRLGILGTFIGLLLALGTLGAMFVKITNRSLGGEELGALVNSMTIAFGTSVAGLLSAILIQFIGESLFLQQRGIMKRIEDAIGRVVTVLSMTLTGSELARNLDAFADQLVRHRNGLADHATQVRSSVGDSVATAERNAQALNDGVRAMASTQGQFATLVEGHNALLTQLRADIGALSGLDHRLTSLLQSQVAEQVRSAERVADANTAAFRSAMSPLNATIEQHANRSSTAAENVASTMTRIEAVASKLLLSVEQLSRQQPAVDQLTQAVEKLSRQPANTGRRSWLFGLLALALVVLVTANVGLVVYVLRAAP